MEAALGIPAGNLAAALSRYNENAANGQDPDFHEQPDRDRRNAFRAAAALYRCRLPADVAELPLAIAEQAQFLGVMLLDRAAVAHADQDRIG